MPIQFNQKQGWHLENITEEEHQALVAAGKKLIVDNIAATYTQAYFNRFLTQAPDSKFYTA